MNKSIVRKCVNICEGAIGEMCNENAAHNSTLEQEARDENESSEAHHYEKETGTNPNSRTYVNPTSSSKSKRGGGIVGHGIRKAGARNPGGTDKQGGHRGLTQSLEGIHNTSCHNLKRVTIIIIEKLKLSRIVILLGGRFRVGEEAFEIEFRRGSMKPPNDLTDLGHRKWFSAVSTKTHSRKRTGFRLGKPESGFPSLGFPTGNQFDLDYLFVLEYWLYNSFFE
nr:hypothetical protein Iba_chr06cCG17980 [Ipomoea batatas]